MPIDTPARSDPRRLLADLAGRGWGRITTADRRVVGTLRRVSVPVLRIALGVVFIWFGALKLYGGSPAAPLVAETVYWVDPGWFVPLLGVVEALVGLGLLIGVGLRLVLLLLVGQLLGTFLTMLVQPDVTFQHGNPLLLTMHGEFVLKNLVLLAAGLVVGANLRRSRRWGLVEASESPAEPRSTSRFRARGRGRRPSARG